MAFLEPKAGAGDIRKPTDSRQWNGRIKNPVRYMKLGGLDGPDKPNAEVNGERVLRPNEAGNIAKGPI